MSGDPAYALAHAAQARARRLRKRAATARTRACAAPGSADTAETADKRRSATQRDGDRAEDQALALLLDAGLVLVARNHRCRAGEIDLIMRDGPILVFVEVRARSHAGYGGALASVDRAKQARLTRAAGHFLAGGHAPLRACRFDVVAFDAHGDNIWIRGAFLLP